ncbi:hypothetical protein GCM10027418_08400 [Mariniluteicoccus endophyticus]
MTITRRGLLVAAAAAGAHALTACVFPWRAPGNPPSSTPTLRGPYPYPPPPPSGASAWEAPGSIPAALRRIHDHVGGGDRYALAVRHDRIEVTYATSRVTLTGDVLKEQERDHPDRRPIDVDGWALDSWPTLLPRLKAAHPEVDDGMFHLEVSPEQTWGPAIGTAAYMTHHGPRGVQVDPAYRPVPALDLNRASDVATAVRELAELGGVTEVSQVLVHASNASVVTPWDARFGPKDADPAYASLHRGKAQRDAFSLTVRDDPAPVPPNLFPLSAYDHAVVEKGRTRLGAGPDSWKGILQRRDGKLVYRVEDSRQWSSVELDEKGNPL